MNLQTKLEDYGLQPKEAEVYLALLELGQATVYTLVRKCNIKRTSLYDILDRLKKNKLINETISHRKLLFYLDGPEKMIEFWKEKESDAKEKISGLKTIMPKLKEIYSKKSKSQPKIKIFQGREEIKKIYNDLLTCQEKEIWSIISRSEAIELIGENFYKNFIKKRVATKIKSYGFRTDTTKDSNKKIGQKYNEKEFIREVYYLEPNIGFKGSFIVYDNKLAVFTSVKEKFGFILESEETASTLKTLLKIFWNKIN